MQNLNFHRYTWLTAYQLRDIYLAVIDLSRDNICVLRNAANAEQARRKTLPEQFVECPRCRGWHGETKNKDNLCEKCEQIIHVFEYDKQHNIN